MRLIDADAFNDWILSHFAEPQSALILTLQGFIAEQPTAYDIDKTIKELEGLRKVDMCESGDCPDGFTLCHDCCSNRMLNKAIEIVKQGSVDDDVCEWKLEDEEANLYLTGCQQRQLIFEGTPKENGYRYCPYCGKKIKIVGD